MTPAEASSIKDTVPGRWLPSRREQKMSLFAGEHRISKWGRGIGRERRGKRERRDRHRETLRDTEIERDKGRGNERDLERWAVLIEKQINKPYIHCSERRPLLTSGYSAQVIQSKR